MNTLALILAVTMTADTTSPQHSFFVKDEAAAAVFTIREIPAGQVLELRNEVLDETDRKVCDLPPVEVRGDGKGEWTGRVPLPTDRYGFFRLVADCGGARLPKVGTRRPGCLTYAVVSDPAKRRKYSEEECFYGFCGSCEGLDRWFGAWHSFNGAAPISAARREKLLKRGETPRTPGFGTIAAGHYHSVVSQFMSEAGRKYAEAHKVQGICMWGFFDDEEGVGYYKEAIRNLVRAAKEQVKGRRVYEVAAEPDLTAPSLEVIVKQTKAAWEVISVEDPEGLVVSPVLSSFSKLPVHRQLFDLGLADWINAFGIHQYTSFPAEENEILSRIRGIKKMIREKKGRDLPMFATEGGYMVPGETAKEIDQMNGLVRLQLILLGEGYSMTCMYYPSDAARTAGATHGAYGLTSNLDYEKHRYGPRKTSPRPVAPALSTASRFTDGHRPTGCLEGCFGETMLGYSYADRRGDCVIALWDWGEGSVAEIPVGRDEIAVADIMGNERTVKTVRGVLRLELGKRVQYVLDPDPKLWGEGGTMAAKMQAEAAKRAAEREARREVRLVGLSPKIGSTGHCAVTGEIENRRDEKIAVTFRTGIRGDLASTGRAKVELAPRETKKVAVYLQGGVNPDPFEKLAIEASVTAPSGYMEFRNEQMNFFGAAPVRAGTAADPFAGWPAPAYTDVPGSGPDLAAKIAVGWTKTHLLFDVRVDDDAFMAPPTGPMSWNGDAIQIALAKGVQEKSTANLITDLHDEAITETTFSLTTEGPQAYRTRTFDPKNLPAGGSTAPEAGYVSSKDCPFEITRETEGAVTHLRYRVAVPWRFLDLTKPPERCDAFRFALSVCDRDPQDATKVATIGLRLFDRRNAVPRGYGFITLK